MSGYASFTCSATFAGRSKPFEQVNFIVWLILVVLLISVDFSLQSSIAFDRASAVWTAWFYTIAGVRVADLLLVGLTVATGATVVLRWTSRPLRSYYLALPALGVMYLGVGAVYT